MTYIDVEALVLDDQGMMDCDSLPLPFHNYLNFFCEFFRRFAHYGKERANILKPRLTINPNRK